MVSVSSNVLKVRILEFPPCFTVGRPRQQHGKVPDFRLEFSWPYCIASPKPQILMHTHRVTVTLMMTGILRIMPLPSKVAVTMTLTTWIFLILNLCKTIHPCHSSWQQLLGNSLCQCYAEFWTAWILPALVFMRALFRGWILYIGWRDKLRIRQLWFPSRLQGWIFVRARFCFF